MKHSTSVLISTLFLAFLSLPVLSAFVVPSSQTLENRELSPLPEIGEPITMLRQTKAYLADHMSARTLAIRAAASIDLRVLGQSPNPSQVLIGSDGWYYLRDTFNDACDAAVSPQTIAGNLALFHDALGISVGTPVILSVAPDKLTVETDRLGPLEPLALCTLDKSDQLTQEIDAINSGHVLNLWTTFRTHGSAVYFQRDSHFDTSGARLWIDSLVGILSPDTVLPWTTPEEDSFHGNLTTLTGLPEPELTQSNQLSLPSPTRVSVKDEQLAPNDWATEVYEMPTDTAPLSMTAVVLKDSFMDVQEELFTSVFDRTTLTDFRDSSSVATFLVEAKTADVVIVLTAEHNVWKRFDSLDWAEQ